MAEFLKKRVAMDLVPISPGKGGTGSGIWTVARELVAHLDQLDDFQGLEILCLINRAQKPYFSRLRKIRCVVFPTFGKPVLLRLLWTHLFLPLWCFFRRVDILHKPATETPLFCSARRVTTVHDFYYEFLMEQHPPEKIRLYERLEDLYFSFVTRVCFKKSRAIVAVSEATRREAVLRFPEAEDRMYTIHHGAPPAHSARRSEKPEMNILCVAKFMEHKGQHLLIRAFELLLQANPSLDGSVRLTLRGFQNDEEYYRRIVRQIEESRWEQSIRIIPYSLSEGQDLIYQDAGLVVLLSSYEGFGLTVLEAQAHGAPVVCSDLPVLREIGGEGAVYVDRDDPQSVAEVLDQLILDRELRARRIQAGLDNVKRFDWRRAAQQTMDLYQKVL